MVALSYDARKNPLTRWQEGEPPAAFDYDELCAIAWHERADDPQSFLVRRVQWLEHEALDAYLQRLREALDAPGASTPSASAASMGEARFDPPSDWLYSDKWAAEQLAKHFGHHLIYTPEAGWMHYKERHGVWQPDEHQPRHYVFEIAEDLHHHLAWAHTQAETQAVRAAMRRLESCSGVTQVLRQAESFLKRSLEEFDGDPWLVNAQNGVVDLRTGRLQPHDPALLMTKQLDCPYDPSAGCPQFKAFLATIFEGDRGVMQFVQRWFGYCLTGRTDAHKFVIFHGRGQNGKSALIEAMQQLMGSYARHAQSDTFSGVPRNGAAPSEDIARLHGARLVVASEGRQGRGLNEPLVKQWVGGDRVTARYLNHNSFEFRPTGKLLLVGNHLPAIQGGDEGIWRRTALVKFNHVIPEHEKIHDFAGQVLQPELPGILNWAVQGCRAWLAQGLAEPHAVLHATQRYRSDEDVIEAFLEECCYLAKPETPLCDLAYGSQAKTLHQAYQDWAAACGFRPMTTRSLYARLRDKGYVDQKRNGVQVWPQIGLRDASADAPPPGYDDPQRRLDQAQADAASAQAPDSPPDSPQAMGEALASGTAPTDTAETDTAETPAGPAEAGAPEEAGQPPPRFARNMFYAGRWFWGPVRDESRSPPG